MSLCWHEAKLFTYFEPQSSDKFSSEIIDKKITSCCVFCDFDSRSSIVNLSRLLIDCSLFKLSKNYQFFLCEVHELCCGIR